ncbi:MAG: response regulator [Planctomycetaceae bacterium]|nr:response regulator [Planctomycetaceae bacterium]
MARQGWLTRWLSMGIVVALATPALADSTQDKKLDPLQWAVVDSLRYPERTTPQELLEAAIRAASVEALEPTLEFLEKFDDAFAAEPNKEETLAALGGYFQTPELSRFQRFLKRTAPAEQVDAVTFLMNGIQAAAQKKRIDADRLNKAAVDLQSNDIFTRQKAANTLMEGGTYALPMLIDLLMETGSDHNRLSESKSEFRSRKLTEEIIGQLGERGVRALVAWLGSDDFKRFPGIIDALNILVDSRCLPAGRTTNPNASAELDVASVLFAPAFIPELGDSTRSAAMRLLVKLEQQGLTDFSGEPFTKDLACRMLTTKLDELLTPHGIPSTDSLTVETTSNISPQPAVEQYLWVTDTNRPEIRYLPPNACRSLRAGHIARDLSGLGCAHPNTVRLVLLAQSEALLVFEKSPSSALNTLPVEVMTGALRGPKGFSTELTAEVLNDALDRSIPLAAAVAARAIRKSGKNTSLTNSTIQSPLVRALAAPSTLVQFEASQTLAVTSPQLPFSGSSRLLNRLLYFANSSGIDEALIVHPNHDTTEFLKSSISQYGFVPSSVSNGRLCIRKVRQSPDLRLIILSARLPDLSASEVVELLQQESLGRQLPILVMLDPLDDNKACRQRTRLVLRLHDLGNAMLTDRLDSQFFPTLKSTTNGEEVIPPRFPETLTRITGPQAIDAGWRQEQRKNRLQRASIALTILEQLGYDGWDIREAFPVAHNGLTHSETFNPAMQLLANMPSPAAQRSLFDLAWAPDLDKRIRKKAVDSLGTSLEQHGILLPNSTLRIINDMYNEDNHRDDSSISRDLVALFQPPKK